MQPFQNPHWTQWHVTVDAFVSHIDRSFIFSIKRSNFVIFKILLDKNSIFNNPELSFSFFRRQKNSNFAFKFWDTLYISVISWDGKPGIYHFCRVIRLPPDSSGNSGDAFNCFLLFPFLSSRSGARVLLFRPLFLARGNESDGARVTRPGSIKGEHGLAGWIYAGYPRGRAGNSVPWIVWQLCGFRAQRFSTVQRLNPVDSYYAGMKYAATI